jgi:hypothetical protein
MALSAAIRIDGGAAGVKASVVSGAAVQAVLDSTDGVLNTTWAIASTDESTADTDYTLVLTGPVNNICDFNGLTPGTAALLSATVTDGVQSVTATCKFYVPCDGVGLEVGTAAETYESDATYGHTGVINAAIRAASSAAGSAMGWREPVRLANAAALPANTRTGNEYVADANGSINVAGIDGTSTIALDDRLLYWTGLGASHADYGITYFTDLGSAGTPWKMVRVDTLDESTEVTKALTVAVEEGTVNGGKGFRLVTTGTITINSTALEFQETTADLVTASDDGIVTQLGAANTVMQTDGSTPGGEWRAAVSLGATPAATGRGRMTNNEKWSWKHSTSGDIDGVWFDGSDIGHVGGTNADAVHIEADTEVELHANGVKLEVTDGVTQHTNPTVQWGLGVTGPTLQQATDTADNVVAQPLAMHAQDVSGGDPVSDPVGGALSLRSGGSDSASATDVDSGAVEIYCGAVKGSGAKGYVWIGRDAAGTAANRCERLQFDADGLQYWYISSVWRMILSGTYLEIKGPDLRFSDSTTAPSIYHETDTADNAVAETLLVHAADVSGDNPVTDPIGGVLTLRSGGDDSATATDVDSGHVEVYCGAFKGSGTRGNCYFGRDASGTAANRTNQTYLDGGTSCNLQSGGTTRFTVDSVRCRSYKDLEFLGTLASAELSIGSNSTASHAGVTLYVTGQDVSGSGDPSGGDTIIRSGGDTGAGSTDIPSGNVEIYCGAIAGSGARGDVYVGVDSGATAANRANDVNVDAFAEVSLQYQGTTKAKVGSGGFTISDALFGVSIATAAGSTYTVLADDLIVHSTYSSTGTQAVTLPAPSGQTGRMVCVKDAGGSAGTNNITVAAASGNVDGAGGGVALATNYIGVWFYCDGSGWWSSSGVH